MTDINKLVLTALGALVVYVLGQLFSKFFIEPVHDLRKSVGEVRFNLMYYAHTIHTPSERRKEDQIMADDALRKSSCDLIAKLYAIPWYDTSRLLSFGVLPPKTSIEAAAVRLRGPGRQAIFQGICRT